MTESMAAVERAMMTAMTELAIALPTLKRATVVLQRIVAQDISYGSDEWHALISEARSVLEGEWR
tara:strand:- start:884 stop:1078 length:195 start_codon:yes stop_codon:yes gene_type:complete